MVRYGNVVGSRGSVLPFFERLKAEGAEHLPITDERMTRFWITLTQGVNFVLSSMAQMRGGEIFVPKIPSMRTVDLAHTVAPGMPHKIVGIRPGEKLHEIMVPRDDSRTTVELADRYIIVPANLPSLMDFYMKSGGRRVPEDFEYASNLNPEHLDARGLQVLLKERFS